MCINVYKGQARNAKWGFFGLIFFFFEATRKCEQSRCQLINISNDYL